VPERTIYIRFLSVSKKEQVLFKSFFNLAKFDFPWDFHILDGENPDMQAQTNLLIVDQDHEWQAEADLYPKCPTIIVGEEQEIDLSEAQIFLTRPIQWTEFKNCLVSLEVGKESTEGDTQDASEKSNAANAVEITDEPLIPVELDEAVEVDAEAIEELELSGSELDSEAEVESSSQLEDEQDSQQEAEETVRKEGMFANLQIVDEDELDHEQSPDTESADSARSSTDEDPLRNNEWTLRIDESESMSLNSETEEQDPDVHVGLELDQLSSDYLSISQSEMVRVVDDVKQFYHDQPDDEKVPAEPVILIADDESSVASSVLILETDASDFWDSEELDSEIVADSVAIFDEPAVKTREGVPLRNDDVFWRDDRELIANNTPLLYVKSERQMVYSRYSPGEWLEAYMDSDLSTLPLKANWRPKPGFQHYPQSYVIWMDIVGRQNERLSRSIDLDKPHLLSQWPSFDLIYQNNDLLKFATKLFLKPTLLTEFVDSVKPEQKRLVTGFLNACYKNKQLIQVDKNIMQQIAKAESANFAKIAV
jgi:hypothetical protein